MKNLNEIIEDIQEAQLDAGGRFLRQKEIKEMTVEQLLNILIPNDVQFIIKHKSKSNALPFKVGDTVVWRGMNLLVVEVGVNEVLIATSENPDDEGYKDWWVENKHVNDIII